MENKFSFTSNVIFSLFSPVSLLFSNVHPLTVLSLKPSINIQLITYLSSITMTAGTSPLPASFVLCGFSDCVKHFAPCFGLPMFSYVNIFFFSYPFGLSLRILLPYHVSLLAVIDTFPSLFYVFSYSYGFM